MMLTRRDLLKALGAAALTSGPRTALAADGNDRAPTLAAPGTAYDEVVRSVIPAEGVRTNIGLGDAIVQLVRNGVIDESKFRNLYMNRGGLPQELNDVLTARFDGPIVLTTQNANFYVNLLWPLGLSNFMVANARSPVNGPSVSNFASTGGWHLGKDSDGGRYFNKLHIVELSPEREDMVVRVAEACYRPCCDNSTFFQDCNHGSALLGVLQRGAAQSLAEQELYRQALIFNSFWFPSNYIYNALYFRAVKGREWKDVDAKDVMGREYSSASGNARIAAEVAKIPDLIPRQKGQGGSCGA